MELARRGQLCCKVQQFSFRGHNAQPLIPPLMFYTSQNRKSTLPLASGLNLEVTLTAAASLDTAGQAGQPPPLHLLRPGCLGLVPAGQLNPDGG